MLVVYIDDSGSNKQEPVMVLAGYVAGFTSWIDFSDEWQAVLDEYPKVGYFKIREAIRLEEQFGRLKPRQRDERVLNLCSIIAKRVAFGVVASFKWNDFKIAAQECPEVVLKNGYLRLTACKVATVLNQLHQCLMFVQCESTTSFSMSCLRAGGIADTVFRSGNGVRTDEGPRRGCEHPIWTMAMSLPLQAADCLAWLMRRHVFKNLQCATDFLTRKHARTHALQISVSAPRLERRNTCWDGREHGDGNGRRLISALLCKTGHYTLTVNDDLFDVEVTSMSYIMESVTIDVSPVYPDCTGGHEFIVRRQ